MNRKDKIKLLQDISAGKVQIEDILPTRGRIWVQDSTDPFSFNCREEKSTRRLEEIPLTETENGFKINNIKIIADSTSRMIYERMEELGMQFSQEKTHAMTRKNKTTAGYSNRKQNNRRSLDMAK